MCASNIDYSRVRYAQESLYPTFSNGAMSVSETYVALANEFLDPTVLSPIRILEHNELFYCIDTRRLRIAKELQRQNKVSVSQRFPFQYISKSDDQYFNFVYERLPAMEKKDPSGNFINDLDKHIAQDHLRMNPSEFQQLNIGQCRGCHQELKIYITKSSNNSVYRFMGKCHCENFEPKELLKMEKPWTEVTLREICDNFLYVKSTLNLSLESSAHWSNSMKSEESQVSSNLKSAHHEPPVYQYRKIVETENDGFFENYGVFLMRLLFIIMIVCIIVVLFAKTTIYELY
ncbi:unnamed protein product [Rotaria magnacalcarata]|uniref:Uncharacterized protein n=3 Tax=Rotaria magnacalcarata TaxID=392030 RepID=A0A815RCD7_9BILA|nr:unnamed protein product [Rotaria magnacalcarata]CAF1669258.1 unnamed protein product [Rotaria magnacalcarata]